MMRRLIVFLFVCMSAAAERPNIILIMADDMGYSDVGCYGGEIDTPNIDRLAQEGMRFRQFYNNAKCTTTRASLMSGRYPARGPHKHQMLTDRHYTLPQALHDAGYRTILSGKWHLGNEAGHRPVDRGFDESYGLFDGGSDYFNPVRQKGKGKIRYFGHNKTRITSFPDDFYTTDAFTDHALGEMKTAMAAGQPYFLHLAYTAPHWPLHAKPEDIAKYHGRYAEGWDALRKTRFFRMRELDVIGPEVKLAPVDPETKPWSGSEADQRRMEVHAAMVDCMDQNIGRVLQLLDASGTADNTLVIFLSDNGASPEAIKRDYVKGALAGAPDSFTACGLSWANALNTPFRKFKLFTHEGGVCTPCVVRWPARVPAGSWCDAVAHIIDFQPTLMALADAGQPADKLALDGEDVSGVLTGTEFVRQKPLCWEWDGNRAVRAGRWKAVFANATQTWALFDIEADRTELDDRAEQYPERVAAMVKAWDAWAKKYNAPKRKFSKKK